jgi:hypothetical protein
MAAPTPTAWLPRHLVSTVGVGVAILAALAVTVLVAPGFLADVGHAATPSRTVSSAPTTAAPAPTAAVPDPDAGPHAVEEFLTRINAADASGARALLCPDSDAQPDIDDAIAGRPQVEPDPATQTVDARFLALDLKGTVHGAPVTGRVSAFQEGDGWCIYTFFALG